MAEFLHGVETIELNIGPRPITVVKSAVIGLVGVAPQGPKQTLTLVQNESDASQFGASITGFSIPQALAAIQAQGSGLVVVVNVFDPAENLLSVSETKTVTNGKFSLSYAPIYDGENELVLTNGETGEDLVTYTEGTDYTVNEFGAVKIIPGGAIAEGNTVSCAYKRFDPTSVSNSQIIGEVDGGNRFGLKVFEACFSTYGFSPRILIAPNYSHIKAISTEMLVQADDLKGHAIIDSAEGVSPSQAIANRGTVNASFYTSSKRAILCYPRLKAYDAATDADIIVPYSAYMAGVIAATDSKDGYWFSPSNREIKGITGVERIITAAINKTNTESNLLNAAGIVTLFNAFGSGTRTWGNRSAAFPSSTAPGNFICVQRTADIIHESLELAQLQYMDLPTTEGLIDAVMSNVNAFMRTLVQRGAIIDGECKFDPNENPPVEIAAGHVTFTITFMPPTPMERVTFKSYMDTSILRNLTINA